MSKLFKIGVQAIKEKTGMANEEVDPKYEDARQRFEIIHEKVTSLFEDMLLLIRGIQPLAITGKEFSDAATTNAIACQNSQSKPAKQLAKMFGDLMECINSDFIKDESKYIQQHIHEIKVKLESIESIKDKRRKAYLLYSSTKSNLESVHQKGTDVKIQKAEKEYLDAKNEMETYTQMYITQVDEIWEHQYEIIEQPLNNLFRLAYVLLMNYMNKF
ncbi:hypothetical protein TVAG_244510 [Trichomonas vaginalis G3]|uniref:BAR domain-containing protein n=1 Tax=Trichomonas vaginalis (strain ATCC PRA-98 / G3) TaxID=412133 RepID=A2ES38_TRIV3|nr:arfaptin homology (AH) domain/bar domain domain-containing protein [Trichomonas vaginalis G3]EAY04550.1 hypothetical protein TVAG_244510 [Trichomonas vaginalis G3]KAI5508498.1 arfaptin homology (AH) domain/bar domain domain-containing protein [Trichomonas vaginalis G3]|eukprot:XP_001316773.1 hypothetical protein [Trichomonas vaginalis G3]